MVKRVIGVFKEFYGAHRNLSSDVVKKHIRYNIGHDIMTQIISDGDEFNIKESRDNLNGYDVYSAELIVMSASDYNRLMHVLDNINGSYIKVPNDKINQFTPATMDGDLDRIDAYEIVRIGDYLSDFIDV